MTHIDWKVECWCGDEIPGANRVEAVQDALNLGWKRRGTGFLCASCLDEQESL